jgi:hypothetical protein
VIFPTWDFFCNRQAQGAKYRKALGVRREAEGARQKAKRGAYLLTTRALAPSRLLCNFHFAMSVGDYSARICDNLRPIITLFTFLEYFIIMNYYPER